MKSLRKPSVRISSFIIGVFVLLTLTGCSKEAPKKDYIAKVNDTFLTTDQLSEMMDTSGRNNFYKNEIIRNWINQELLYQQALKEGIVDEIQYNRIIDDSKKSLAAALLLKNIYDKQELVYEMEDLVEFFLEHKEEFGLFNDSYLLNIAMFNSEDKAIEFRNLVMEGDWMKASDRLKEDTGIINNRQGILLAEREISPVDVQRMVPELFPREVSIVFGDDRSNYKIVQVLGKYSKGTIPPFELIKDKVESRFLAKEKDKFITRYIRNLYEENDIEVKN
jgi:hypothetical protein